VVANYVANHDCFHNPNDGGWMGNWHDPSLSFQQRLQGYKDGTSNTLGVTEAYARCNWLQTDGSKVTTGTLWAHEPVTPDWHAMFNDWTARGAASKFQVQPSNPAYQCNRFVPQSIHSGGIRALLMDGSVKLVGNSVDPNVWAAALTPSGGETLSIHN